MNVELKFRKGMRGSSNEIRIWPFAKSPFAELPQTIDEASGARLNALAHDRVHRRKHHSDAANDDGANDTRRFLHSVCGLRQYN